MLVTGISRYNTDGMGGGMLSGAQEHAALWDTTTTCNLYFSISLLCQQFKTQNHD